jgi:ABC-2 type transport system ATP-binding protein
MKTSGSAAIWLISTPIRNAKASIGIVPQEIMFDPFLTPKESAGIAGGPYGVPKLKRYDGIVEQRLEDSNDAYARTLSGAAKRRLLVAKAMVQCRPL